jgi:lysophospholipase L1-like esterase
LVQLNQITTSRPSILFVGDSYAEGQGASPWFYNFERRWPSNSPYQVINGGIQGTGVETWERLYRDISSTANVKKLVMIFISDDWTRSIWQLPEQFLECLHSAPRCNGADAFLGLPENPAEAQLQIERIAKARVEYLDQRRKSQNMFRSSAIYSQLLKPAYELWRPPNQQQFEKNKAAALRLARELGPQNVLFVHMPQKDELRAGPNSLGRQAANFIRQNGFLFEDGFAGCSLMPADFHQHDGHPNSSGYGKMGKCIEEYVKKAFDLSSAGDTRSLLGPEVASG